MNFYFSDTDMSDIIKETTAWNITKNDSYGNIPTWEEGVSLALVGYLSSDDVTIKVPYWVDVL